MAGKEFAGVGRTMAAMWVETKIPKRKKAKAMEKMTAETGATREVVGGRRGLFLVRRSESWAVGESEGEMAREREAKRGGRWEKVKEDMGRTAAEEEEGGRDDDRSRTEAENESGIA